MLSFAVICGKVNVKTVQTDVCVIGGGPAGSVLAARLAALGHTVSLIERAQFPRRHLGESLSPGVLPLLDTVGARQSVEDAGFSPVESVLVNWDEGLQERRDPDARGLLVDRGRFDALLLQRAAVMGVQVLQPAVFRECRQHGEGWSIVVEQGDQIVQLSARFLADASGRAFATRGLKRRTGARATAFYAYWQGESLPKRPRIEAGSDAWFWGVPLPGGLYNTLVFVDPRAYRPKQFLDLIGRSSLLEGCRDVCLASQVLSADATPYLDEESVTPCSIKVGDAALTIDPLSSSGVQKAIQTSLAAAIVVNTLLRKPESGEHAIEFYRSSLADASDRHCRWAGEYYGRAAAIHPGPFWRQRASEPSTAEALPSFTPNDFAAAPLALSPELRFLDSPCIDGAFVTVKPALHHPSLDRPVAYVGGCEVTPLLRQLPAGLTPIQIARLWSDRLPLKTGLAITGWLASRGLLIPAAPLL